MLKNKPFDIGQKPGPTCLQAVSSQALHTLGLLHLPFNRTRFDEEIRSYLRPGLRIEEATYLYMTAQGLEGIEVTPFDYTRSIGLNGYKYHQRFLRMHFGTRVAEGFTSDRHSRYVEAMRYIDAVTQKIPIQLSQPTTKTLMELLNQDYVAVVIVPAFYQRKTREFICHAILVYGYESKRGKNSFLVYDPAINRWWPFRRSHLFRVPGHRLERRLDMRSSIIGWRLPSQAQL